MKRRPFKTGRPASGRKPVKILGQLPRGQVATNKQNRKQLEQSGWKIPYGA